LNFQPAPVNYSQVEQNQFRSLLGRMFAFVLRSDRDVELASGARYVVRSSNGSRFALVVDNAGNLSTTAL
jgi:hypothetical protein